MKQKDILIILIPGFIITILWVVFSVYHNYTTSTITDPLAIQIIPIAGNFDANSISKIKSRQSVNPVYESQLQGVQISPTPTNTPATQSAGEVITVTPSPAQSVTPTPGINGL